MDMCPTLVCSDQAMTSAAQAHASALERVRDANSGRRYLQQREIVSMLSTSVKTSSMVSEACGSAKPRV